MKNIQIRGMVSIALVVSAGFLAGCETDAKKAAIQHQVNNPEITVVGTFDGCEVKYVNRYYQERSFYLARCSSKGSESTTAETSLYTTSSGRSSTTHSQLAITEEIQALDRQKEKLEVKAAALKKLSSEEQEALGLTTAQ